MNRRDFIKGTGLSIGVAGAATLPPLAPTVSLVIEPSAAAPVLWAAQELTRALTERGTAVRRYESLQQAPVANPAIVAAQNAGLKPDAPESFVLASAERGLLATGSDSRGLMYALLEVAGRVRRAGNPMDALNVPQAVVERPANKIRSIARLFVSDVEDKPWFNDREMWPAYFAMLAKQRFNRFHLAFGIGYDFLREVTDAYFVFVYPFLVTVPGHNVKAVNLSDAERDRNLEMLRFISEQAVAHGIDFQLGIWTHGYQWTNSPHANYTIAGVTPENHATYCRDALGAVLKSCPAISGVTFRVHGESGVAEGNYDFWKTVFSGVSGCGRKVEIDMHAKGMDQAMIDVGLGAGVPLKLSPKFWAEHLGMPYHQADIRAQEIPRPGRTAQGLMALSSGSRSFTRYGYADLLREDRRYGVIHRIWPGTWRLLLSGDPVTAAAYSRAFSFCGTDGVDLCEPLSFKGRRGSGIPGGRCAYADASLKPHWDWEKYAYSYAVWGRLLYNPAADPATWSGAFHPAIEGALASASRILPIVTTTHLPSAANNTFWPEIYTNQPIVDARKNNPYSDTPAPKVFGNVSPGDPQLFSRISDFAGELLKGERSGKYSPIEVAQWIEDLSDAAAKRLADAPANSLTPPASRRAAIDIQIHAALGHFFAAKFRSAVLYSIHESTQDRAALEESLKAYRRARDIWAQLANTTKGVYVPDITVGELPWLRGHWIDRLPAIDADIADMAKLLETAKPAADQTAPVKAAILAALGRPQRSTVTCLHTPPAKFQPGQPVTLSIAFARGTQPASARLYYRHVNQAERFESAEMQTQANGYHAAIPGAYTASPYPLQYYFELHASADNAWLHPGFAPGLTNQPYFVVRS